MIDLKHLEYLGTSNLASSTTTQISHLRLRAVVIVLLLVFLGIFIGFWTIPHVIGGKTANRSTLNVFSGTDNIGAGKFYYYKIQLSQATQRAQLVGNFTVSGAGNDDTIRFLLFDPSEYNLFQQTGNMSAIYNTGVTSSGNLDINIPHPQVPLPEVSLFSAS